MGFIKPESFKPDHKSKEDVCLLNPAGSWFHKRGAWNLSLSLSLGSPSQSTFKKPWNHKSSQQSESLDKEYYVGIVTNEGFFLT